MTSKESKALKNGDLVAFSDGVRGIVVNAGNVGVRMKWDDGQEGVIHHNDMHDVSRVTGHHCDLDNSPISTKPA